MSAHRQHPPFGADGGPLLYDDCPGCARHVKTTGLTLDPDNFAAVWDRMVAVEHGPESYRSHAEAKIGRKLYEQALVLERFFGLNPWRSLSALQLIALVGQKATATEVASLSQRMKTEVTP